MSRMRRAGIVLLLLGLAVTAVHSEIIEEIVAIVNGEIITKTDFEEEEQLMVAEIYRQASGTELDKRLEELKNALLMQMIDQEIRLHFANRQFDTDRLRESFYEQFVRQQMADYNLESEADFEALLARDGMTVDELKDRLVRTFAPEEVLRYEVGSRVSIDMPVVQTFYDEHPGQFHIPGEVTIREIVLMADSAEKREQRKAEADAIVERTRAGESFEELATELSESGSREQEGLLGTFKRGDLSEFLEEVAFAMNANEISEPIETPYGLHIIKIDAMSPDQTRPFEEVKEQLRGFLENRQYAADVKEFTLKIRSQANWCVKPKYIIRLPGEIEPPVCTEM